jgi:hypothetical protein
MRANPPQEIPHLPWQTRHLQMAGYLTMLSLFSLNSFLVLYGLVIAMAFLINPFLFFYYEEKEEGEKISKVCENKFHLNFFKNKTLFFISREYVQH